jgi:hypothetical protein
MMASIKKGQITRAPSYCGWWKHLRREGKRVFWKQERQAQKAEAKKW